jgi:hypothetical protein
MPKWFDIVMMTDWRLPRGTSTSVAEEISAQARIGCRAGLLHVPSELVTRRRPFNERLRAHIEQSETESHPRPPHAEGRLAPLFEGGAISSELDDVSHDPRGA